MKMKTFWDRLQVKLPLKYKQTSTGVQIVHVQKLPCSKSKTYLYYLTFTVTIKLGPERQKEKINNLNSETNMKYI